MASVRQVRNDAKEDSASLSEPGGDQLVTIAFWILRRASTPLDRVHNITIDDVTITASESDTIVSVDVTGDGQADFQFTLVGVGAVDPGDFLFA